MDKFVIRTVNAIYAKIANFRISPQISKANFAHANDMEHFDSARK